MIEDYSIRRIPLQYEEEQARIRVFLSRHHLRFEEDIEAAFGIFDSEETLIGCGCAAGRLLKCFAEDDELRGQNALGPLVSALAQDRFAVGHYDLFVITRTYNEPMFKGCGFFPVVRTPELVMLENRPDGPETFCRSLKQPPFGGTVGAIVMNANPFTLGHRYLVESAAAQCDLLHIFVVEEDRSLFPADVRRRLVEAGTADLPNVRVHFSGPYMISVETFPTYFLKQNEDAARLQAELDITLFARRIAPALGITARFAGQEPLDPVTANYNKAMETLLPLYGVRFVEIPRLCKDGRVISASCVRGLLGSLETAALADALLPPSTREYLASTGGRPG